MSDNPMFLYEANTIAWTTRKRIWGAQGAPRQHLVGTFDAAVITKKEKGKVKIVDKTEKPTQHGGWAGLAVGAAIGLIFPPSILVSGLVGAGAAPSSGTSGAGCPTRISRRSARCSTRARRR